jgi:hypothetical protein
MVVRNSANNSHLCSQNQRETGRLHARDTCPLNYNRCILNYRPFGIGLICRRRGGVTFPIAETAQYVNRDSFENDLIYN